MEQFGQPVSGSIPTIIRSFKSAVTKRINEKHKTPGSKLWQRNYWEHIIRNETELSRISEYIRNNPIDFELKTLPTGTTQQTVIPAFFWPDTGQEKVTGLYFHGVMLNETMDAVLGEIASVEWGYGPY